MTENRKIWLDGQIVDEADAKISVFDHCVLYGDGVFEGIRIYDGCVFRLREHIERLWSSAKYIMLEVPMSRDEMVDAVAQTVRANGLRNGYIRLVVTRGVGDLGLSPANCGRGSVFIIAANIRLYPEEDYQNGMEIVTVPTRRYNVGSWNGRVKSCNYLNNIMAKIEGQIAGAREALMLDHNGMVVECTGDNIFIVKNGVVNTPPVYLGALRGVTRDAIMDIAEERGMEVREDPFTRFEIFDADECFLTGTAAEVIPVTRLDGRSIADGCPGPVTLELLEAFRELVKCDGVQVYEK
ncbi:branched-chain-amino-acid transaminase [candidate division BRC1 bacterium HGW-BRC1-1]|jgi:branched-chain amino acid aminotransferase|nr:MAG: branched-chain-amino-acid transaminase [candidate division BRC1 bacterium HGW-BRC1-1]